MEADNEFLSQFMEIQKEFLTETQHQLGEWEELVLNIEQDTEQREHNLKDFMRKIHNLKGAAGSYDVPVLTSLCHKLESVIQGPIISGNWAEVTSLGLHYIDLLKEIISVVRTIKNPDEREPYFKQLWQEVTDSNPAKTTRILMISSSRMTYNFLKSEFKRLSEESTFDIDLYQNGLDGLGEALKFDYDVIICDNVLPQLNGIPIIASYKQMKPKNKTITILLSSDKVSCNYLASNLRPDAMHTRDPQELRPLVQTIAKSVNS